MYAVEGDSHVAATVCQLVLMDSGLKLISGHPPEAAHEYYSSIFKGIRSGDFATDIVSELPDDFAPRAILRGANVVLIVKDTSESECFTEYIRASTFTSQPAESPVVPASDGRGYQHFRWSEGNWTRYCAKVALEYLSLFEGVQFCLRPELKRARAFAASPLSSRGRRLVFNERGPATDDDVPSPVFVDLSRDQAAPTVAAALLFRFDAGMHAVALYEIGGWVCASVSIAGFPPSLLVLGGPEVHLSDLFVTVYDDEKDSFHHLRLPHDTTSPVIPLALSQGTDLREIAQTYGLRLVRPLARSEPLIRCASIWREDHPDTADDG